MLTASCMDHVTGGLRSAAGIRDQHFTGSRTQVTVSLHIERRPVLDAYNLAACRVPLVDAVVLAGAKMVVLRPLERPPAQALEVDLQILHRRQHLRRRRRPS